MVRLLLEPGDPEQTYLGSNTFLPGAHAPVHKHADSEELVYILSGQGTMPLGNRTLDVARGVAVRIPPGVEHSFRVAADEPMEVVQVYSPGGPEQRFRRWDTHTEGEKP
jgi:mannose-6-phosphate isomerase-like protein (cupin superfamily)